MSVITEIAPQNSHNLSATQPQWRPGEFISCLLRQGRLIRWPLIQLWCIPCPRMVQTARCYAQASVLPGNTGIWWRLSV